MTAKYVLALYDALREISPQLETRLTATDVRHIVRFMVNRKSVSVQMEKTIKDGVSLMQFLFLQEYDLYPVKHIENFVDALRSYNFHSYADRLLPLEDGALADRTAEKDNTLRKKLPVSRAQAGTLSCEDDKQRGVTKTKENIKETQYGATQKTDNADADTVHAAAAPTGRRKPYPGGKGRAIIIYIAKFDSTATSGPAPEGAAEENEVPGNAVDGKKLAQFFRRDCGFFVEEIYNEDATYSKITETLEAVASDNREEYAMFVCAVLSHGGINRENKCYVYDFHWEELLVEDIIAPFKEATSLAAKPKVFIFNACRGEEYEDYHTASGGPQSQPEFKVWPDVTYFAPIPREAHFLHFYSSVQGYRSLSRRCGSAFVTTLLNTLRRNKKLDVVAAFTDVTYQMTEIGLVTVAKGKDAARKLVTAEEIMPTPCILSTLTKPLYFR